MVNTLFTNERSIIEAAILGHTSPVILVENPKLRLMAGQKVPIKIASRTIGRTILACLY